MKVALVYDRLNKLGGAEQVLLAFHALYPQADWYTSVWDPHRAPFTKSWQVRSSWVSSLPYLSRRHEWLPWLMPFIFESFDFSGYDLVVSIGSAESKGILAKPGTRHVNYCLTPTRYLYSHSSEYLSNPLYRAVARPLRAWDQVASTRPDLMIAISEHVKSRIKKYYNRDSEVIYPPVATQKFAKKTSAPRLSKPYYLTVSRLVPYKKLDLIIKAFNRLRLPLVVVGEGSEQKLLKRLAGPTIRFTGFITDKELISLYQGSQAFIYAAEEDFGISMVESLAAGRPVIAYGLGGAAEIVKHHETGILFSSQSENGIIEGVKEFERLQFNSIICQQSVQKFDISNWQNLWLSKLQTPKS